jgi:exodeoxyribonuclease VII small subunit
MSPEAANGKAASDAKEPTPVDQLTYEQARDELQQVVGRLEQGGVPLEDSLALWERGEALADVCQNWLDGARTRIEAAIARRKGVNGEGGAATDIEDHDADDSEVEPD